jgi:hypothetical protein
MYRLPLLCFLVTAFIVTPLSADTVIDIEAPGMATRLMMDDRFARVDNAADGTYLLHDRRSKQSYLVLPATKQVMKLEDSASKNDVNIRLVAKKPSDARIFGYPTQRYQLFANQQYCGEVFASTQAMKHLAVETMLDSVARLVDQQMHAMGPYIAIIDSCTQASMRVLDHVGSIGMPLRLHDARGALLSDIVNIDTQAELEEGMLAYPSEYTLVDSVKELSPTQNVLKSARKYSPQLDSALNAVEKYFKPGPSSAQGSPRQPVQQPYPQRYQQPYPSQNYR